jgi:hypothetical protein
VIALGGQDDPPASRRALRIVAASRRAVKAVSGFKVVLIIIRA